MQLEVAALYSFKLCYRYVLSSLPLDTGFYLCFLWVMPLHCEDSNSLIHHLPFTPLTPACLGAAVKVL